MHRDNEFARACVISAVVALVLVGTTAAEAVGHRPHGSQHTQRTHAAQASQSVRPIWFRYNDGRTWTTVTAR